MGSPNSPSAPDAGTVEAIRAKLLNGLAPIGRSPRPTGKTRERSGRLAGRGTGSDVDQLDRPELMLDLGAELSTVCQEFGISLPRPNQPLIPDSPHVAAQRPAG